MTASGRNPWRRIGRWLACPLVALAATVALSRGTQDAVANGDTRTLYLFNENTKEEGTFTFKRNGAFDSAVLGQLNWFMRDWRRDEQTRMDPRLFDLVWEVHRQAGSQEAVRVVSGYRSPDTNSMLRRRSRVVAEFSQHMQGKAMDFFLPDVSMSRVREIGMRMQDGGVGFYPNAFNPFVHLDVGSVRAWPRMGRDQLARLFPDGKTVHLPRDGKPLEGYEFAKAEIIGRGGAVAGFTTYAEGAEESGGRKSLWAMLFGGGEDEDAAFYRQQPGSRVVRGAGNQLAFASSSVNSGGNADDAGTRGGFAAAATQAEPEGRAGRRGRRQQQQEVAAVAPVQPVPPQPAPTPDPVFAAAQQPPAQFQAQPTPEPVTAPQTIASLTPSDPPPQPPRRPDELRTLLVEAPLPPSRPIEFATLAGSTPVLPAEVRGQMRLVPIPPAQRPAVANDDRSQLKSLFEAVATPTKPARMSDVSTARSRIEPALPAGTVAAPPANVRVEFSSASLPPASRARAGMLACETFAGAAVEPLPILR